MRRNGFCLTWAACCTYFVLFMPPAAYSSDIRMPAAQIDRLVARAMSTFAVPGIAVGVVKDDRLIFAKGYGVRQLGTQAKVGADTLFMIGSNTKAFTAAALALLVDEGKIRWDDKVIDHLPQFQLYDAYVTREITIRDLLSHRSGLGTGAGDLLFATPTDYSRQDLVRAVRYLKPAHGFRSQYAYNNLLFVVAGEIIPAVTGLSWEDFVESRILRRLAMQPCAVNHARVRDFNDVAVSHVLVGDVTKPLPEDDLSLIAAAGAIECNITGMAKWLRTQLAEGKSPSGEQLFSVEQGQEMWSAQTPIKVTPGNKLGAHFKAYGLGWGLTDVGGYKVVQHSGETAGMTSMVIMVPELKLGIVVLVNHVDSSASTAIALQILNAYAGKSERDWVATLKAASDRGREEAKEVETEVARVLAAAHGQPPLPLSAYAGTYHDDWRGDATIRMQGDRLVLKFSHTDGFEGSLQPYSGNVFVVRWNDRSLNGDAFVRFEQGYGDTIEGMTMQAVSPTTDFSLDFQDLDLRKLQ